MAKPFVMIMGATRGLGKSLVEVALELGFAVLGLGRSYAQSNSEINADGLTRIKWDVTDESTWEAALTAALQVSPEYLIWNVGIFNGWGRFADTKSDTIDCMIDVHIRGPMKFLREFHTVATNHLPGIRTAYHLIVIASKSSYETDETGTLYAGLEAGKAHFVRNFARELWRDLRGSRSTLVHPGAMQSGLLVEQGEDVSRMMPTRAVAEIIWREVRGQTHRHNEFSISRMPDGTPILIPGIPQIEAPFP